MNIYKAFYKGRSIEVEATTSYSAQQVAAKEFKAKKEWEVTVILVAKDDKPVVHIAVD
jgi:hypothetical protein